VPGSIGLPEILMILVIALVIFGPRRLPEMGRTIGKSLREFRRAASDLRSELEIDVDESPRASMEERARRLEERGRTTEAAPARGDAPPT
jgi:sec-independent protein translocase protein TatA